MGYAESNITMESRIGSVSSGLGGSPGTRRKTPKSSPFCPRSSSKLTQSIIKDHMVSHYKKVYSAKAAIDASVPKSLLYSVKYNDQLRREQLRKGGRPQSAHTLLQRNSRTSCCSAQSRLSVQYDDSPYLDSRSSVVSSPRFSTSFNAKERKQSSCSLAAESSYKTFQDPVQKTYSGDLLQKHSQHFTQDKPFTPKTLKSDKNSYLLKYRYYRAPQRKPTQDCSSSRLVRQETYHGSTKNREYTGFDDPSQEFITEHEWSEDDFSDTHLTSSRQQSRTVKTRNSHSFELSPRHLPSRKKSPAMMGVSTEEEELMYLEFISDVTEDILSRGHISDRVLDRVIKRHIDMNRHQLEEGKMRHLLEVLRKDFEKPIDIPTSSTQLEERENDLLDTLLPHLESEGKQGKPKEDTDLFTYVSLIKDCDSPHFSEPLMASTQLYSPEITTSPTKADEKGEEGDNEEKGTGSPLLREPVTDTAGINEEDFLQIDPAPSNSIHTEKHEYSTISSDKDQADNNYQAKELEDLGRYLTESLHVSSNTHCENLETEDGQRSNTAASVSDDEF